MNQTKEQHHLGVRLLKELGLDYVHLEPQRTNAFAPAAILCRANVDQRPRLRWSLAMAAREFDTSKVTLRRKLGESHQEPASSRPNYPVYSNSSRPHRAPDLSAH
jgi:hypothetical protein